MIRTPWTDEERRLMREHYGRKSAPEVAAMLGRPVSQVHGTAERMGLGRRRRLVTDADREVIRRMHAEGCADPEIARTLGWKREIVGVHRRAMGLAHNAYGERQRQAVAIKTAEQIQSAGVRNLAEVRALAWSRFAIESGWPADLRIRHVQILNLMAAAGVPLSRREIAEGIGARWVMPTRKNLVSNDPEGSYLAHLTARGLVTTLPRALPGQGKGRSFHLYCLGPVALAMLQARAVAAAAAKESSAPCATSSSSA